MTDHELEHSDETYEKGMDFELWRKLWRFTKPYRKEVKLLCLTAVITAGVDAALPLVTKAVIDDVQVGWTWDLLIPYGLAYLGLTTVLCLCIWAFIVLAGRIRTSVSHDIRKAGFENLQRLSFSFYDHRAVGWLMARMTSDCERLSNILAWGVLDIVWGITVMACIAAVMLSINVKVALFVLAVVPLLLLVSAIFQKRILKSSRVVRKTNSRLTAAYNEGIMGVQTSKVFVREEKNLEEFTDLSTTMYGASVRNALQSALFLPMIMVIGSLGTGLALVHGGVEYIAGSMTVGALAAFMMYTRQFFDPVHEMGHWYAEMQMARASAERILGLIEEQPEIADSSEVIAAMRAVAEQEPRSGIAEDGFEDHFGELEFRDVSFRYRDGDEVLRDFDLRVAAGERIALVGSTGGGKSTIVGLLCRFYEPTEGEILIDGVDYRRRSLHWLQSNLGIVLQTPHLFSGTVADNIRYGRLDASDEEVIGAAMLVEAHEFIAAMEQGYETEVGEGGVRLSTGQKQLISFARAVLAAPQILVMDEATSSIDTETEKRIQRGLERVLAGRTSFVIAHRLSTIRNADRILVIEHGEIREQGSHAELMRQRGRYHELYMQQSLRESGRREEAWSADDGAGV